MHITWKGFKMLGVSNKQLPQKGKQTHVSLDVQVFEGQVKAS